MTKPVSSAKVPIERNFSSSANQPSRVSAHEVTTKLSRGLLRHVSAARLRRPVQWTVVGRNGVTAKRTIDELLPQMPDEEFDYILVGLGGNDVMKLSSPRKWRRDMTRLLGLLKETNPDATIFITNCPMIKYAWALPHPIRFLLWQLSKLHDKNIKQFTADLDRVFYYHQPAQFTVDGFFSDGIHPSEQGYADWSAAMMRFFDQRYKW